MSVDPYCSLHGKRWSEHPGGRCLYCCLCFKPLTLDECHKLPDGSLEDVCEPCAEGEVSLAEFDAQPTDEDEAYERAQASEAWERKGGGGL